MSEQEVKQEKNQESNVNDESLDAKNPTSDVSREEQAEQVDDKEITVKQSDWNKLETESKENKDKYLRLFAEFENMRKRNERERLDFIKYANEGLIIEFLELADNFQRSLAAYEKNSDDVTSLVKGLQMMSKDINKLLEKNQVKPIEIKRGAAFDPNCMEILMQEETTDHDDGAVIEVYQTGFKLGDRIVRTAKVKVALNKK